jgi:hypothetical protein
MCVHVFCLQILGKIPQNDYFVQRICRDIKLLDAVFEMTLAARKRCKNPWSKENEIMMTGPKGLQKVIYVTVQRMLFGGN